MHNYFEVTFRKIYENTPVCWLVWDLKFFYETLNIGTIYRPVVKLTKNFFLLKVIRLEISLPKKHAWIDQTQGNVVIELKEIWTTWLDDKHGSLPEDSNASEGRSLNGEKNRFEYYVFRLAHASLLARNTSVLPHPLYSPQTFSYFPNRRFQSIEETCQENCTLSQKVHSRRLIKNGNYVLTAEMIILQEMLNN